MPLPQFWLNVTVPTRSPVAAPAVPAQSRPVASTASSAMSRFIDALPQLLPLLPSRRYAVSLRPKRRPIPVFRSAIALGQMALNIATQLRDNRVGRRAMPGNGTAERARVLIADDDEGARTFLRDLLELDGYETVTAECG